MSRAESVLGNAVCIDTRSDTDVYSVCLRTVLASCADTENRNVQVVVGFPGVFPVVLSCTASPVTPLRLVANHAHVSSPVATIARTLMCKGNDRIIHELIDGQQLPQYYHILAQFLVLRLEFQSAARVVYRIVERVRCAPRASQQDLEAASAALCQARSLLIAGGADSFSIQHHDPAQGASVRGTQASAAGVSLRSFSAPYADVVTLQCLFDRRTTLEAEIALLKCTTGFTRMCSAL